MVKLILLFVLPVFLFACASSRKDSTALPVRGPTAAGKVYFRVVPSTPFIKVLGPDSMDVFFSTPETYADSKDKGVNLDRMQVFNDLDVTLVSGDLPDGRYLMFAGGMWRTAAGNPTSAEFTVKGGRIQKLQMKPSGEFVIIAE